MATDFIAGCIGGMAGVVVGHPLDTVKVRIQTQCARNPVYRGTFDCLRSIMVKEGTRGLYRGLSSPMVGVAAVNALTFGIHGNVRRLMANPDSLSAQFRAGMIAGGCQAVVVSPMELVKSQLQVQGATSGMGARYFTSPLDCCRQLLRRQGPRGLMRGYWITVVREVPAFGIYFSTYEILTTAMAGDGRKTLPQMLLAGGLAGVASWVFTYPIDVVKTRIQTDGMSGIQQYEGYVSCVRQTVQREGWQALMRGVNSASIRAFPTNAVTLALVSVIMEMCHEREVREEVREERVPVPRRAPQPREEQLALGQRLPLGQLGQLIRRQDITVTQMTVQIEARDGGDSQRRRQATIKLDGRMAMDQLRRLLDREVAALHGQMALPISAGRALALSESHQDCLMPELTAAEEEAVWRLEQQRLEARREDEAQLHAEDSPPCRHVRRETTVVTRIVEYDVGDDQEVGDDHLARVLDNA